MPNMTACSHIDQLWVADWPKARSDATLPTNVLDTFAARGMVLDTCLRQLCLAMGHPPNASDQALSALRPGLELHFGADAYRYALEVATGLHSAIPGETNVFGQFKKAWKIARRDGDSTSIRRIAPWIHQLINDARSIRSEHLQDIGGASYGTLVRRLLSPRRGERVLFVGAGDLAQSILPYFQNFELGLWNHRPVTTAPGSVDRLFAPEDARDAAAWTHHVVFTTPPDERNETSWRTWLSGTRISSLVHLGYRCGKPIRLHQCSRSYDLGDVFELRQHQAGIRSSRLTRARTACADAALALMQDRMPPAIARLAVA
jgi:Glutamyl-tRNAGlu reductase, N-terminal domain